MYSNITLPLKFSSPWWSHSFRHTLIRVSLFLACQTGYWYANWSTSALCSCFFSIKAKIFSSELHSQMFTICDLL